MKKGTILWTVVLFIYAIIIVYPPTRDVFSNLSMLHPYILGFINFAILSTMGELLAIRITSKEWELPVGIIWRFIVWGIIGLLITLVFQLFTGGVLFAMDGGYLPMSRSNFVIALLTSATMNILFAPTFMMAHKIAETYIDLRYTNDSNEKVKLSMVIDTIDFNTLISFVFFKTIPMFWIPAHTIAFLLPPEFRVIMAAALSIVLGVILSIKK